MVHHVQYDQDNTTQPTIDAPGMSDDEPAIADLWSTPRARSSTCPRSLLPEGILFAKVLRTAEADTRVHRCPGEPEGLSEATLLVCGRSACRAGVPCLGSAVCTHLSYDDGPTSTSGFLLSRPPPRWELISSASGSWLDMVEVWFGIIERQPSTGGCTPRF